MDQLVAKRHDLRKLRDAGRQGSVQFGQLIERFADDLELALYRGLRHGIGFVGCCVHADDEALNGQS